MPTLGTEAILAQIETNSAECEADLNEYCRAGTQGKITLLVQHFNCFFDQSNLDKKINKLVRWLGRKIAKSKVVKPNDLKRIVNWFLYLTDCTVCKFVLLGQGDELDTTKTKPLSTSNNFPH